MQVTVCTAPQWGGEIGTYTVTRWAFVVCVFTVKPTSPVPPAEWLINSKGCRLQLI